MCGSSSEFPLIKFLTWQNHLYLAIRSFITQMSLSIMHSTCLTENMQYRLFCLFTTFTLAILRLCFRDNIFEEMFSRHTQGC